MTTEIKTIEKIRASYTEKEITKLDELKDRVKHTGFEIDK